MFQRPSIHWLAPTAMLSFLLLGIIFAIAHHVFYQSLDHGHVPARELHIAGIVTSQQQVNISVGTAFAFLVKAFLAASVSIAFVQSFWRTLTTTRKSLTLDQVDTTYSLRNNLGALFVVKHWWRSPFLFLLALIVWSGPLLRM